MRSLGAMSDPDLLHQIRSHQPSAARAYYLWNASGRFPTQGGFSLDPISTPFGLLPGEYRIGYLSEISSNQPLQPRSISIPAPTIRISGSEGQALAVTPAPAEKSQKSVTSKNDPIDDDPDHLRNRVEFEAIKMADQTVTNQQLVAKRLTRNRELGELLVYARAHRQELEQNLRFMSQMSREMLSRANTSAQLLEARRGPEEQTGPFVGILGQILQLLNSAVSGSKGKGESILDALVSGEEDGKLAELMKEVKRLKAKTRRAETKSKSKAKSKSSTKGVDRDSSKRRSKTKNEAAKATKKPTKARKQLPAKRGDK